MQRTPKSSGTGGTARSFRSMLPAGKITACHRCHERKVKCSGGRPCQNCRQSAREDECSYPLRNRTVKVPQSFLNGLLQEIETLKQHSVPLTLSHDDVPVDNNDDDISEEHLNPPPPDDPRCSSGTSKGPLPRMPPNAAVDVQGEEGEVEVEEDTSPAISIGPWFDSSTTFKSPVLIGEAADAAFATRFRQVISDPSAPQPAHLLRLNYASNQSLMSLVDIGTPWPGPSRARFLLEAAMKYIQRSYHIVQRQSAIEVWDQITRDSNRVSVILQCRCWALFAIGELYITKSIGVQGFPGMAYFAQASKALGELEERPEVEGVELHLLLSFYSMALNRRYSAYIFAGTAVRSAIVIGLHLTIPEPQLPDAATREHRKRLFWTAYVFDRLCASNLNHPPAIQDDDISVELPCDGVFTQTRTSSFVDAEYHIANIRLAGLRTAVIRSVYNVQSQAQGTCANLSNRVQTCLKDLQLWYQQLPRLLQIDETAMDDPQDLRVVSIHLFFYQCVILATRPLLLHSLRIKIGVVHHGASATSSKIPPNVSALSEACVRCAHHTIRLLSRAWIDGTFVTFDCFFTQHLFSSLTIVAISSLLESVGSRHDRDSYEEASRLLDQLKVAGNMVAQEYSHHVEMMQSALLTHMNVTLHSQTEPVAAEGPAGSSIFVPQVDHGIAARTIPTTGITWPEPPLQQLLAQPVLDLPFLEAAVREEYSQGLYWPDMHVES